MNWKIYRWHWLLFMLVSFALQALCICFQSLFICTDCCNFLLLLSVLFRSTSRTLSGRVGNRTTLHFSVCLCVCVHVLGHCMRSFIIVQFPYSLFFYSHGLFPSLFRSLALSLFSATLFLLARIACVATWAINCVCPCKRSITWHKSGVEAAKKKRS